MTPPIFETARLAAYKFTIDDAPFIVELVNSPLWLKFIGDRGVRNTEDAEKYLLSGPIASYQEHGFGLWRIDTKAEQRPIGMCGLLKRDYLDDVDIGFAFLPQYLNNKYGYEIASATLRYAKDVLDIKKIVAITNLENVASIHLLGKLGLTSGQQLTLPSGERVQLFS